MLSFSFKGLRSISRLELVFGNLAHRYDFPFLVLAPLTSFYLILQSTSKRSRFPFIKISKTSLTLFYLRGILITFNLPQRVF